MSTSAILQDRKEALWEAYYTVKQRRKSAANTDDLDAYWREMDAILRELERLNQIEPRRKPPS